MINKIKLLGLAAAVALAPTLSSALTLTIDDMSTVGVDQTVIGATMANFSGTAGGFDIQIASGGISTSGNAYTLNTSSIQVLGVGSLQISAEQTNLTGFSGPDLSLIGSGTVSDIGLTVTVEHFINTGSGYQTVGNVLNFAAASGPVNLSDITYDTVAMSPMFDLKSVFTIVTDANYQSANVNSTLRVTPVPLPAGGILLLTALGGMGIARRRKKA
ncbi:VPLPA-CTERM sorting domain-containing protein [Sedimentitalea nanhaiensis]|uniref:VPLPA-CTERM protein sorting domain-containing protein n=1 Tax=Sedimentitalea nanhaiensis TaxID=999627 RepID=A0A1I7E3R4_9RHOB|nr:VPLPA-CTERM sorting domain-containing protein [Sedimentitalea nanhaiensis]SFU18559.1 VPLPA-CTERM protein sorting domain-containing protein [Sedimentitalea nanhaiensis]